MKDPMNVWLLSPATQSLRMAKQRSSVPYSLLVLPMAVLAALSCAPPAEAQSIQEWLGLRWELWRIDVDGSDLRPLDQTPGRRCGSPQWSPDGKSIAYDVMGDGKGYGDAQIAVIGTDGSESRLIGGGAVPAWSPDGKVIVCQTNTEECTVVMNPDGRGRETVFELGSGLQFTPRGDRLFSVSNRTGGGGGIWLLDLVSGQRQQVFPGPYAPFHGYGVSADGLRICFGSGIYPFGDGKGSVGVATLDPETMQAEIRWLVYSGIGYHASWAPDGRRIVIAWRPTATDLTQLYLLDVESGEGPTLLPGLDTTRHNVNPDWSPDGKSIVFSSSAP